MALPDHKSMFSAETRRMLSRVEEHTGYGVQIGRTEKEEASAEMTAAADGHPVHLINVAASQVRYADYIVAVQCAMLLTMWTHPAGIPKFNPITDKVVYASRKASQWKPVAKLSPGQAEDLGRMLVTGLLHQLRSTPAEMLAIESVFRECPSLRIMQAECLNTSLRRSTETMKPMIKDMTPPTIWENNLVMSAALALSWCNLAQSDIAMLPYKSIGLERKAAVLVEKLNATVGTSGERSVATTDAWADELGLRTMYAWTFQPKTI